MDAARSEAIDRVGSRRALAGRDLASPDAEVDAAWRDAAGPRRQ